MTAEFLRFVDLLSNRPLWGLIIGTRNRLAICSSVPLKLHGSLLRKWVNGTVSENVRWRDLFLKERDTFVGVADPQSGLVFFSRSSQGPETPVPLLHGSVRECLFLCASPSAPSCLLKFLDVTIRLKTHSLDSSV